MIRQARPDAVPLNHLLEYIELDLSGLLTPAMNSSALRERILGMLNQRICQVERHRDELTQKGLAYVGQGDCILVHGADDSLISTLVRSRTEQQTDFQVVLADFRVSPRLGSVLGKAGVAYNLVRPGKINNCLDGITKIFFGAMSVTRDKKILAPSGTGELVQCCRQAGLPLYFFADSLHYAFGRAGEQTAFKKGAVPNDADLDTPARDLVCLSLMDHVITEIGEVTKTGLLMPAPDKAAAA